MVGGIIGFLYITIAGLYILVGSIAPLTTDDDKKDAGYYLGQALVVVVIFLLVYAAFSL